MENTSIYTPKVSFKHLTIDASTVLAIEFCYSQVVIVFNLSASDKENQMITLMLFWIHWNRTQKPAENTRHSQFISYGNEVNLNDSKIEEVFKN